MSDILKLYRGDAEKIRKFDFHKTNKYCLLGQGVYLTDKVTVADSYRNKGSRKALKAPLFKGIVKTKGEAMEKAFENYIDLKCIELYGKVSNTVSQRNTVKERHLHEFFKMTDTDQLIITKTQHVRYQAVNARSPDRLVSIPVPGMWNMSIELPNKKDGYTTSFEFPRAMLENNVINIDQPNLDVGFLELVHDSHILHRAIDRRDVHLQCSYPRDSIRGFKNVTSSDIEKFSDFQRIIREAKFPAGPWMNKLTPLLKPYGVLGYRYNGGVRIGGNGLHNAYCIWDDEFVNQHKVARQ